MESISRTAFNHSPIANATRTNCKLRAIRNPRKVNITRQRMNLDSILMAVPTTEPAQLAGAVSGPALIVNISLKGGNRKMSQCLSTVQNCTGSKESPKGSSAAAVPIPRHSFSIFSAVSRSRFEIRLHRIQWVPFCDGHHSQLCRMIHIAAANGATVTTSRAIRR